MSSWVTLFSPPCSKCPIEENNNYCHGWARRGKAPGKNCKSQTKSSLLCQEWYKKKPCFVMPSLNNPVYCKLRCSHLTSGVKCSDREFVGFIYLLKLCFGNWSIVLHFTILTIHTWQNHCWWSCIVQTIALIEGELKSYSVYCCIRDRLILQLSIKSH